MSLVAPCAGGPENSQPPLYVINDGIEALELLRGGNGKEPLAKPYIIILDQCMPRMDGREFRGHFPQRHEFEGSHHIHHDDVTR